MFEHKWAELKRLNRVEREGQRLYECGDAAYPSITTVLSGTGDKSGLHRWRKRVGEEQANKISQSATRRGTAMHSMCEEYLLNNVVESKENHDADLLFKNIRPYLDEITTVRALESALYSNNLKVAGTVDCIAEYKGKLTVIDFKTANKEKDAKYIEDYFLQGCFYYWAFYEQTGEMPEQIAILISSPAAMQEFIVPKSDIIKWTDRLRERISAYSEKQNANNTTAS